MLALIREAFWLVPKYRTWDYVFRTAGVRTRLRYERSSAETTLNMSREVTIGSRRFWIVSEPHGKGWKAQVLEVMDELGGTHNVGIETTGDTRSMADDRAIGQLQHRLRDQSF